MINLNQVNGYNNSNLYSDIKSMTDDIMSLYSGAGSSKINVLQYLLLNITGSTTTPYVYDINTPIDKDFKCLPVNVLKVQPDILNSQSIVATFTNSEISKFDYDSSYVLFDGDIKLKTDKTVSMSLQSTNMYEYEINLDDYLEITQISIVTI